MVGMWERLQDAYIALENRYYGLVDWLAAHGIPLDRLVTAIESNGIPSFPIFALVVALILAGAGYGLYSAFGPKTYTITIYDDLGNPLANMKVLVDGKEYFTDESGQITLKGVKGPVRIQIEGYEERTVNPLVSSTVRLEPLKKKVIITVKEAGSGRKLAAIKAKVYGDGTQKEFSENPFTFYISRAKGKDVIKVKDGKVLVEVLSSTHGKKSVEIEWEEDTETIEKTVYMSPISSSSKKDAGRIVVYVRPSNVSGTAKLMKNGVIVKETIFQDGVARFYSIPYDEYVIKFEPKIKGVTFTDPENQITVKHNSRETTAEITLKLPAYDGKEEEYEPPEDVSKYYATVRVYDENTEKPLSGAEVVDANTGTRIDGRSKSDGIITVGFESEDAELNVYVRKSGYYNSDYFTLEPGDEYNVYLKKLPDTGTLELCVKAPVGGGEYAPVASAYYELRKGKWEQKGNVGVDGCAKIEDVPVGDVNIYVTDPYGYYPTHDSVEIKKDKTVRKEVILTSKVTITVIVYYQGTEKQVPANVKVYTLEGKKIAEAPTGLATGARFELPANVTVYFVVEYGGNMLKTKEYTFKSSQTVKIYVPEELKNSIKFSEIVDPESGSTVFMLEPGKTYNAVFEVTCKGTCSYDLKGDGIEAMEPVSVNCSTACMETVDVPVKVTADGTGIATLDYGAESVEIPYGYELTDKDRKNGAYARIIAYGGNGNFVDHSDLMTNTEYKIAIPFAAELENDNPDVKISGEQVENVSTEIVGRYGDYVIGIVRFTTYSREKGRKDVSVDIDGAYELSFTLRFSKEGELKEMKVEAGALALKGCEWYKIPYRITETNEGNTINAEEIFADIYLNGDLYDTYTLSSPEGELEIPTHADNVLITFRVLGYRDANVQIELEDVQISTDRVTLTLAPDRKSDSKKIRYSVGPDWLELNYDPVDTTYRDYRIKIRDIEVNEGTVEVSTDKGEEYFTDTKYEPTITQKAWAETDDYRCQFDVHPQITIEETSEKIACKDVTCETILNNTSILKENGKSSEKGYEIAMIISNNSEEVVNCLKDKVEGGKESYPTATLKIKQGNSESTESIPIPLYSKGDRVYYLDGTQIVEQSSGGIWNGSDGVTITFEPEKSGSKLAEHVYIPYCGKVTYTLEITCENKVKRASNTLTIPCKSYTYYDVSKFFKIAGAENTENSQDNCKNCTTVYEVTNQGISINFNSAEAIGENENDLDRWYGPYVLAARLSNGTINEETKFRAVFGSVDDYKPTEPGITVTAYSCTKDGTGTGNYSCETLGTDTCVQSSNDQELIIYEVVQNNGSTNYRFCTTDANLAWLYMEQSKNVDSGTPWIIPAEVKVTQNNIQFENGDPLDGCPVYDAEVNIPAVWIDPENNVSVFGKSLSDYYRIVAASVGANGKDTTGVKTFLGTDELNTVPPFNIGLKTGAEAISTEPSIVTNSGTGTVNVTYQTPTPKDDVTYVVVYEDGTLLYVYPDFAGYTRDPLSNELLFETAEGALKDNQNIKPPECQEVRVISVDITLTLHLNEVITTCSAQNCTENGCTLTCGEVTILYCTDPFTKSTTVEVKAETSATTTDSQTSWNGAKVTYGSLTKEGSIGETINLGQKSYSCPSGNLWNEVQEDVSVDLYGTRNDTSITVPASGTVTVRIGNAQ